MLSNLGFMMADVARLVRVRMEEAAQAMGTRLVDWHLLLIVMRNEGIRQVELARLLEKDAITVSRSLDRLEAAGWVDRRRDPDDRRAFRLYNTPASVPMIRAALETGARNVDLALTGVDPEQRQALYSVLQLMQRKLLEQSEECDTVAPADRTGPTRAAERFG